MKKIVSLALIAATLSTGLMGAPAYADRLSVSIGDGGHYRHDRWDRHDRHHRWDRHDRNHRHWRQNARYNDAQNRWFLDYYSQPVVQHNSYYMTSNYPVATTPVGWNTQTQGYCREYNGPVNIGGRIQQSYGTACLMPDGSWQIVD